LFQYYTLVRLLQQKQVVLLLSLDGQRLYLFYHDGVYTILTASLDDEGPIFNPKKSTSKVFIWSLIDIQERDEPNWRLTRPPYHPWQQFKSLLGGFFDRRIPPLRGGICGYPTHLIFRWLPFRRLHPSSMDGFGIRSLRYCRRCRWDHLASCSGDISTISGG